jgi:alkylation response protein AidB-like acyl-CoA dehydrogenase
VIVPRESLIGEEGRGLKIALVTLNTGRLALPATTAGGVKALLEICRKWCSVRVQWGQPIGKHEFVAHKLADMAASTFAMTAVSELAAAMAERPEYDIRLEAAAAKEWNTVRAWHLVDEALGMRGGRGYETETSLAARGEVPIGVERAMRDARINRIFEGSSEIMHLFMAREAVDKHLQVAGVLIDPKAPFGRKMSAALKAAAFYGVWFPLLCFRWGRWPRFQSFGALAPHLRFAERASRKLARSTFYGMLRFGARLEKRQAFLFRLVDVAMELFAMVASVVHARNLADRAAPHALEAERLADLFCRTSRRDVAGRFHALWHNDDAAKYEIGRAVLDGRHEWLESGIVGLRHTAEELEPQSYAPGERAAEKAPPPSKDTALRAVGNR